MSRTLTSRNTTPRRLTLAIERIADERRFAERFRSDPQRALRRYRLGDEEIEAIKAGDPASLQAHGVDVVAFADGKRHGLRRHWRRALAALGTIGVALSMSAAPASAARDNFIHGVRKADARQARLGRAISVRGVLVTRSSIKDGLRRQGFNVRAQGRADLRAFLDVFCTDKPTCGFDLGDGEPILLSD